MAFPILSGAQLAGGNPSAGYRTENDFYATDPKAVAALFNALCTYDPDFQDFTPQVIPGTLRRQREHSDSHARLFHAFAQKFPGCQERVY